MYLALEFFHGFGEFHVAGTVTFVVTGAFAAKVLCDFVGFAFGLLGLFAETRSSEILGGFAEMMHATFHFLGFTIMTTAMVFSVVMFAAAAGLLLGTLSGCAGMVLPELLNVMSDALRFLGLACSFGGLQAFHHFGEVTFGAVVAASPFLVFAFRRAASTACFRVFPFRAVNSIAGFAFRLVSSGATFAFNSLGMVIPAGVGFFLPSGMFAVGISPLFHELHQAALAFGLFGRFRFRFVLFGFLVVGDGRRNKGEGKGEGGERDEFLHGVGQTRDCPRRFQGDAI